MSTTILIIAVANAVTLVLGGTITFLAWRAYRRTESAALRSLSIGIGLVTLGTLIGGSLHQLVATDVTTAVAVQSVFVAVGFAVLGYSLSKTAAAPPIRSTLFTRLR